MTPEQIDQIIYDAIAPCTAEQQLNYTLCFREIPKETFESYIMLLPKEQHLLALQSIYVGFMAGSTKTRMSLIETFLKAAGASHVVLSGESHEYH